MDPDANLREQLEIIERQNGDHYQEACDIFEDFARLRELVTALSDWIRKGGTLPRAWRERMGN